MTVNQYSKSERNDKLQTSMYIKITTEAVESKASSMLFDFAAGIQC